MTVTDYGTLPELANLLADAGWVIYEYKAIGSNCINMTIYKKENGESEAMDFAEKKERTHLT